MRCWQITQVKKFHTDMRSWGKYLRNSMTHLLTHVIYQIVLLILHRKENKGNFWTESWWIHLKRRQNCRRQSYKKWKDSENCVVSEKPLKQKPIVPNSIEPKTHGDLDGAKKKGDHTFSHFVMNLKMLF